MISVLCVQTGSNYNLIPGLDLWDIERDAYKFNGSNPVISHSPCQQWSKLKAFAKEDKLSKELSFFCFEKVVENGGIFEHPAGSSFFKEVGISKQVISIDQLWWGHPARKRTYLYFSKCKPLQMPISFDAYHHTFANLGKKKRNHTPVSLCQWLVDCVSQVKQQY